MIWALFSVGLVRMICRHFESFGLVTLDGIIITHPLELGEGMDRSCQKGSGGVGSFAAKASRLGGGVGRVQPKCQDRFFLRFAKRRRHAAQGNQAKKYRNL